MIPIPRELWFQIAKHVPPDRLKDLFSVNSALFNEAMNERYREIRIDNYNTTVKSIQRLQSVLLFIPMRLRLTWVSVHSETNLSHNESGL